MDGRCYALGPRSERHYTTEIWFCPIAYKLRAARFRWYGHVLRANGDTVHNISLNLEDSGWTAAQTTPEVTLDRHVTLGPKDSWCEF